MNIGLYFGAFNPIHDGHLQVANYAVNNSDLDKVWLVLTPQSPHKIDSTLIDFNHRYKMLEIVCKKHKNILLGGGGHFIAGEGYGFTRGRLLK